MAGLSPAGVKVDYEDQHDENYENDQVPDDHVRVKLDGNVRDLQFDEFYQGVISGRIPPDCFIQSSLTSYRWVRAARSPLFETIIQESGMEVLVSQTQRGFDPATRENEAEDPRPVSWKGFLVTVLVCAILLVLLLYLAGD